MTGQTLRGWGWILANRSLAHMKFAGRQFSSHSETVSLNVRRSSAPLLIFRNLIPRST